MDQSDCTHHDAAESEHLVQLFDGTDTRCCTAARFLLDGFKRGESLLVAATRTNWTLIASELQRRGCAVPPAIGEGQLTVVDAHETLAAFMEGPAPDRLRFHRIVGSVVRRLAGYNRGLRVYGEMVDVLAEQGNLNAAEALEQLWNDLAREHAFTLLCGYASARFADASGAAALGAICGCHTQVLTSPLDELGAFLLAQPEQPDSL